MEESDAQKALRAKLMAIQADASLTDAEKAQKRQQLLCGNWTASKADDGSSEKSDKADGAKNENNAKTEKANKAADNKQDLLEDTLKCVICCGLCERPVTAPCQHNFCLNCFKRWLGQGKKTCPTCRAPFPNKFCENPRINTLLTYAIRCAKQGIKSDAPKPCNRIADESRPAEAFTTERAVRNGRANAASGRIMVNVPNDHFGPILPEHDPTNGKGVQVGDWWKDRLDCRQWGAHFPHVAGIAGQSNRGAQSVVLSGGYEDDHDEGEWFLYTGSGGRDLSGNKRTNKTQSFDQEFENMNKALKISCLRGLPVRVVRSAKEKRSSYAPPAETPVRYDGIYRILRCWRKKGAQGFLMCRYLFVRCDNSPAPWTSDETGDVARLDIPDLAGKEIKAAKGTVFEMGDNPYWDFNDASGQWGWSREAPASQKASGGGDAIKKLKKKASAHERLLRDFSCSLCKCVLDQPLSMPCGHNFCKGCLDAKFAAADAAAAAKTGSKALAEAQPVRALRVRKVARPCPTCKTDLCDYLTHAAVNTEMAELIRRLQEAAEAARQQADAEAKQLQDGEEPADQQDNEDGEQEDEGDAEQEEEEQEEGEDQADGAGCSTKPPPAKKQRAAAAAKPSAAAAAAAAAPPAATEQQAEQPQQQEEQPAAPGAAAAGAAAASAGATMPAIAAGGRYTPELTQLCESFPEFDRELIAGLLEDQGGDAEEVHAYLKRMRNQAKREQSKKQSTAAAGEGGSGSSPAGAGKSRGGGKKGRGKPGGTGSKTGSKGKKRQLSAEAEEQKGEGEGGAAAAAEDTTEQAEGAAGDDTHAAGVAPATTPGATAAAAADGDDGDDGDNATAAEDDKVEHLQRDTQPASDTDGTAAGSGGGSGEVRVKPAAAAAAAATAATASAPEAGSGDAAAAPAGDDDAPVGGDAPGRKRRQAAASGGGRAKRAK